MFKHKKLLSIFAVFAVLFCLFCMIVVRAQEGAMESANSTASNLEETLASDKIYPPWIDTLALNYGISKSQLTPLYDSGMGNKEILDLLESVYPMPTIQISDEDLWELAFTYEISFNNAVKAYQMALKYRKDPKFLVDLFMNTKSWGKIESAFDRYKDAEKQISLASKNVSAKSNLDLNVSNQLSNIYRVNISIIQELQRIGISNDDLKAMLFLLDLYSEDGRIEIDFSDIQKLDDTLQLPEEIKYINGVWPERKFPANLLPLSFQLDSKTMSFQSLVSKVAGLGSGLSYTMDNLDFKLANSSPFDQYFEGTSETIDSRIGHLNIKQTDFTLPGRYGTDFTFTRIYDSGEADLEKIKINENYIYDWGYDDSGNYVYGVIDIIYSYNYTNIPDLNFLGMPSGWTLEGIPVLKSNVVEFGGQGVFGFIGDYCLKRKDFKLLALPSVDVDSYTYDNITAKDALKFADGSVWYFGNFGSSPYGLTSLGLPIAYKNKFGEFIRFTYTANNSTAKVDKIIDTLGRVIKFTHQPSSLLVQICEYENGPVLQSWTYNYGTTSRNTKTLASVHPPTGGDIVFQYVLGQKETKMDHINLGFANVASVLLMSVTNPATGVSKYNYSNLKYWVNSDFNSSYYCDLVVNERWDEVPTSIVNQNGIVSPYVDLYVNRAKYDYTPTFQWEWSSSVTYQFLSSFSTTCKLYDGNTNNIIKEENWYYDVNKSSSLRSLTKNKVTLKNMGESRDNTEIIETTYEYFQATFISLLTTKTTVLNLSNAVLGTNEITKAYVYDEKNNIIAVLDSLGNRIDYEYDSETNVLLSTKEYYSQSSSVDEYRLSENTLDATKRVITQEIAVIAKQQVNNTEVVTYQANGGLSSFILDRPLSWQMNKEVASVSFNIFWSTKSGSPRFNISYRKIGTKEWVTIVNFYEKGPLFGSLSGTYTNTFIFPEKGFYEIRIFDEYGYLVLSSLTAAAVTYNETYLSPITAVGYEYSQNYPGNVTAINTYPLGTNNGTPESRTTFVYDLNNAYVAEQTTNATDANNYQSILKTSMEYDKLGRVTRKTVTETGNPLVNSSPSEAIYTYDALGRVTRIDNPPLTSGGATSYKSVYYNDLARQIEATDELGNKTRETYDGLGRVVYTEWKEQNGPWNIASYVKYDSVGRQSYTYDAAYKETKYEYDALNRTIKVTAANNTQTPIMVQQYYSDVNIPISVFPTIDLTPPSGMYTLANPLNLGGWTKTVDAENNSSYAGYDMYGQVVWTATNPKTNPPSGVPAWDMTWYEYDRFGRIVKDAKNRTQTDWEITEYEYSYNNIPTAFNSPLTVNLPGSTEPKYIYEYNSRGQVIREYQENQMPSQGKAYEYDELGRIKRVTYPTMNEFFNNSASTFAPIETSVTRKEEFFYSKDGLIQADAIANNVLESRYQVVYNPRGFVTQEGWVLDGSTYSFGYTYDVSGNMLSMTYPDSSVVSYSYDELHRIKSIPGYFEGLSGGFQYDLVGNLTDINAINGVTTHYTYNNLNMVTQIAGTPLNLSYTYTSNGNISKIVDASSLTPKTYNYTYDARGQLKTAEAEFSTYWNGMETVAYTYDGVGNRTKQTWSTSGNLSIHEDTYDYTAGSYLSQKSNVANPESGVWTSDLAQYTWDSYGQMSSSTNYSSPSNNVTSKRYVFGGSKRLSGVDTNGTKELYTYDALGRRLKVISSTEITINLQLGNESAYEIKKDISPSNSGITTTKYISVGGKHLAKEIKENQSPSEKYFHHIDLIGSIRAISNISGTIIASYEYEPFGIMLVAAGTDGDNLGFGGKRLDGSGLSYFGARYYDAEIGRFISRDPAFDGRNWFAFCNNNPLVFVDPSGLDAADAYLFSQNNPMPDYKDLTAFSNWWRMYVTESSKPSLVTSEQLTAMGFKNVTKNMVFELNLTLKIYDITSTERISHFLAQCAIESGWGANLIEAGYLSSKNQMAYLEKQKYYPYYGAGYIQLTWEYNYSAFAKAMNDPKILSAGPEYVAANYAWRAAGWFWSNNNLNLRIDNGATVKDITLRVNGAYASPATIKERENAYNKILKIF